MHEFHLFSLFNVSLGRSELFDLVIASAALLGVGWRGDSSYHKVYPPSGAAGLCPELFSFTRCVVRHLGNFLFLASRPCLIWTVSWGLRSFIEDPFGCFICQLFWRGLQSGHVNLRALSAWPSPWVSVLIFSVFSLMFLVCLLHSTATGWRISCGIILVPWFPADTKGSKVFGETA